MDFYIVSSLKQQHAGRHGTTLGTHYPDCEPTSICFYSWKLVLSGETANTNVVVFGLKPTDTRTHDIPHYKR